MDDLNPRHSCDNIIATHPFVKTFHREHTMYRMFWIELSHVLLVVCVYVEPSALHPWQHQLMIMIRS